MWHRLRYFGEVFKRAAPFAGWVAGLVTLLYGGSIIGGAAWLAETHHRTLAVALLAGGVLLAFAEGSYRLWLSVSSNLASAQARVSELDVPEAKRAYIDEQVDLALGLRRELEGVVEASAGWQESEGVEDLVGDLDHWEDEVRADLKESFSLETARLFSSDAVAPPSPDGDGSLYSSRANALAYVDRRIARLQEIRHSIA
ncbi:MAG TPA: hypothetical protein VKB43_02060 [Gaiellaceae bacterium]|nr:hypothetical protein [Gaiellaceae bacterium]